MDLSQINDPNTLAIAGAIMFVGRSIEALIGKLIYYKQDQISHFTEDDRRVLKEINTRTFDLHYSEKENQKSLDRIEREISKLA